MDTLTIFEEKAIDDLALALVDHSTDRAALADRAESTAQLLGCTVSQLFAYMQMTLCSIMSYPRELDFFSQPMINLEFAKANMRRCRHEASTHRIQFGARAGR